jgi:hypothetical protein
VPAAPRVDVGNIRHSNDRAGRSRPHHRQRSWRGRRGRGCCRDD